MDREWRNATMSWASPAPKTPSYPFPQERGPVRERPRNENMQQSSVASNRRDTYASLQASAPITGLSSSCEVEIAQLNAFERLPPNWNSYGAKPVSHDAVSAATDLLKRATGRFNVRPDLLAPVATGAIQLEWFGTNAEIEVRANPNKTFTYVHRMGEEYTERHNVSVLDVLTAVSKTLAE